MDNNATIQAFLNRVIDGIKKDAEDKSQDIPVKSFRVESEPHEGRLYAADYFKYLVTGRPPGKQPPPDKILAWVSRNPETQNFTDLKKRSLAYVIGRKIGREGTEIWAGRRHGIDFLGVLEKQIPGLVKQIAKNEVFNIETAIRNKIK